MDIEDSQTLHIAIASDHAGYEAKEGLKKYIQKCGFEITDFGTNSTNSVNYPEFAVKLSESVAVGESDFGVLICGTGIGMSITANKISGVRAALCRNIEDAKLSKQHNNANILILAGRQGNFESREDIFEAFIESHFEGGRHEDRVNLIHQLTGR